MHINIWRGTGPRNSRPNPRKFESETVARLKIHTSYAASVCLSDERDMATFYFIKLNPRGEAIN